MLYGSALLGGIANEATHVLHLRLVSIGADNATARYHAILYIGNIVAAIEQRGFIAKFAGDASHLITARYDSEIDASLERNCLIVGACHNTTGILATGSHITIVVAICNQTTASSDDAGCTDTRARDICIVVTVGDHVFVGFDARMLLAATHDTASIAATIGSDCTIVLAVAYDARATNQAAHDTCAVCTGVGHRSIVHTVLDETCRKACECTYIQVARNLAINGEILDHAVLAKS